MEKGHEFLTQYLKWKNVTDYQVSAVNLLLYHSFGPSKTKQVNTESIIYENLGDHGMTMYKEVFDNNNKELVRAFFRDEIIIKLWPVVERHMTERICFEKKPPNPDIELTFREISRIMSEDFNLQMPQWWLRKFPPTPVKLSKK
jgi:hypothetical protein